MTFGYAVILTTYFKTPTSATGYYFVVTARRCRTAAGRRAGVFVLIAAVDFEPRQAKGMDATLRSFAGTPAGPWLLVLVAAGLVLFGGFSFASARRRRL